jgi:hypothetical protein
MELLYSIRARILRCRIASYLGRETTVLSMRANSGGQSGSLTQGSDPLLANNPDATWIAARGDSHSPSHSHGGPIPVGKYLVMRPGSCGLRRWIPIEPYLHFALGRDSFAIHSEGPHGSDGCIVVHRDDYRFLYTTARSAPGSSRIVGRLEVVDLPSLSL